MNFSFYVFHWHHQDGLVLTFDEIQYFSFTFNEIQEGFDEWMKKAKREGMLDENPL